MRSLRKAAALLLTLAMLVGMVAIPAAAAEGVALSTTMEQVEGDIYKLTFHVTSDGLNASSVVLSYDKTIITPVNAKNYAEVDVTKVKPAIQVELLDAMDEPYALQAAGVETADRGAIRADVYSDDPDYKNESALNDAALFSFYFKLSGELAKGSFKVETDKSEGSILSMFYKTEESLKKASGALVSDKTGTNYVYNGESADTMTLDLTYPGSDKQSLDKVTLSAEPTAVTVNGVDDQTVTLKPEAVDVDGEPYPTDAVTYDFKDGGTGATLEGNTITVPAKAAEGTITVTAQLAGKTSNEVSITVSREPAKAATVELYRNDALVGADETLIIPVKGENTYTYTVKVTNQYGTEMTDAKVDWSFVTADEFVDFADGTVTVKAGADKSKTYTLTATVDGLKASTTITVKDIEITWPTVTVKENPTYGDTWGQIVTISGGSASINGQPVEGTFYVVGADTCPDAGDHSYVLNFTSTDKLYNVDYTGKKVTVAPKAITITGVTATDRPYDKTTTVEITGGTLVGVLEGDTVTATVPKTGTVESANAGTGLAVTLDEITIDSTNYALTQPTGITVNITKAEITSLDVTSVADVTVLDDEVNSIDDVKALIPVTKANAAFGKGLTEEVTITWTTSDSFVSGTGKTYTFTGTVNTDNLDGSKLTALTAKVIVTEKYPVEVTVTAPADITFGKTLGEPKAEQKALEHGTDAKATWKYEYEGVDGTTYARSETKPTQAGSYVVYATLVSETHAGSGVSATFKINPKNIKDTVVTMPAEYEAVYNGTAFTPDVTVKDGETTLVKDTDYTLSYANNINAGIATVTVTGKGNYTGTNSTCTFEIAKASLTEMTPTIVGTAQVGSVLTAKLANVANGQYTWTWYRGETAIDGATAASYVLTKDDSNKAITVVATAVADGNYEEKTKASAPVTVAKQAITGTVVVTASAPEITEGTKLEADAKISPNVAVAYQWNVNGTAVEGETGSSFTVPADSAEKSITVTVTPSSEDYTGSITSAPVVVGKTMLTGTVTLAKADDKITATVADAAEDSYDIVWLRDGQVISGATGTEYTVTAADKGHDITVKLTAKGDYTGELLSAPVNVKATEPAAPTVSASAGNGQVTVSWTVSDNGGKPITSYTVQCNDETAITLDAATTSYTFTGLTNGTEYTFTVKAINELGAGAAATASATPTSGGSSGGGGGGGGVTTYSVTVEKADNGTVTVSSKSASKDAVVTITIAADKGYALNTLTVTDKDGKEIELTKVNDTKYTFKMPASKVTVKAAFVKTSTLPFTDVAADAWYYNAVAYVYEQGMMKGTNDGTTFSPAMNLTRGMMAQILYNLEKGTAPAAGSFTDVAADAWYADAVNWAAANGIVNGYGNGKFGPEDSITREQMAVLLYNYAKFKGYDMTASGDLTAFSDDEKISGWAEYAMKWAVGEKLINGSNNALNPLGTASRAEVAQILMNFGQNVAK